MQNLGSRLVNGFLLTALLLAKVTCAQNLEIQSGQPVIYGEINGMKIMAQGDAVAFMAASHYAMKLDEEACARDLHCAMQKNRTETVVLNPEGIWIFDTPPKQLPDNVIVTEPLYPVSPEVDRLFSTAIEPTPTHIPLEFPQPTATLHTGNEVVDKTPGILLVSTPVREWLAETVTTVSHSRQAMDSDESLSPIIEPTPTQQKAMLTTITEEEDELLRKLTSTSTMPMPTTTPTGVENRLWEDGSIRLEMDTDILTIKPSPGGQYQSSSQTTQSLSFTVKKAPSVTGDRAESTISENTEAASTATNSITAESLQASNLPTNAQQTSEGGGVATGVTKIDQKVVEMTASEAQASASEWRLLVPSPLDLLVAAKKTSDLTTDQKRKIFSYIRCYNNPQENLASELSNDDIEEEFESSVDTQGIAFGFSYIPDWELTEELVADGGWGRPNFDGAITLATPDYLSPDYFKQLLKQHPSQDQVEEKGIRPVLAKEPLIRPMGLPEFEKDTLKAVVLYRIQQQYSAEELEDPNNPGHLPPLSIREIRNLITRCALPERELVRLVGVSETIDGDPIDNVISSGRDGLLKALLERLGSGVGADQSLFDKGGKLEHWRYIPEYTADEKRALLTKKTLTWLRWPKKKVQLRTPEEIAAVTRVFEELSDNDIHYRYGDAHIHRLAEQFFGRLQAEDSFLVPEYSAERKRAIVARHCQLCHKTEEKPCSEDPPCQLFDDDDQMHQRYSDADIRMMEIRVYDHQQDQ